MRASEFQQAAALFAELGDYREAEEKYNEAMYYHAESLLLAEDYKTAAEIFTELGLFKDSKERVKEAEFAFAQALMEQGKYEQAQERFKRLGSYQGARRYAEECRELILVQKMSVQWDGEWNWIHPGWINPYDTYYIDIAKREIHWAFKSPATEFHHYYSFKLLDVNTIVADGFRAEDDGCEITIRMVEPGKIKLEYPRGGDAPSSDPSNLYLIRPQ